MPLLALIVLVGLLMAAAAHMRRRNADAHRLPQLKEEFGPSTHTEIEIYRKRLAKYPKNSTEWAILGELLFSEFKIRKDPLILKEVEACARKSLAVLPVENAGAQMLLAQVLDQRHSFTEALKNARAVLQLKPNKTSALSLLVTAQIAQGDYELALESAMNYLQINPEPQAFAVFGLALSQVGRFEQAVEAFENGLRIEKSSDDARTAAWMRSIYARTLLKRDKFDRAQILLEEALKIVPDFPLALDLKGEYWERKRNFEKASEFFLNAFQQTKEMPYLLNYARSLDELGRAQEAMGLRKKAASIVLENLKNPQESTGHRLELVEILLHDKNWKESLPLLKEELKIRHSHEVYFALSRSYFFKGDLSQARLYLNKIFTSGTDDARHFQFAKEIEQHLNEPLGRFYGSVAERLEDSSHKNMSD